MTPNDPRLSPDCQPRSGRTAAAPVSSPADRSPARWLPRIESARLTGHWLGLAALFVTAGATLVSCGKKEEPAPPPPVAESASTNSPAPIKPEFAKLPGKWQRADGDYLVEIKGVEPSGRLSAAYFNPNPIKVSRAAAFQKEGATQVFIELRDQNYPGCTYTLTNDPKTDQLYGQYYQAAVNQTFDVTFARAQ